MLFNIFSLILFIGLTNSSPIKDSKKPFYDPKVFYNNKYHEGDILLYSSSSLNYHAVSNELQLWPNGEIVYELTSGVDSLLISAAMEQITRMTNNCIKFREKQEIDQDYVRIFTGEGCFSEVGKKGGVQQLSLGPGCNAIGVIVHELLHVVGFYHHHSRSDRDEYLDIFYDNIQPSLVSNFRKLDSSENQLLTSFDYHSIMMYGSLAFSKDGYNPTMLPKDYTIEINDPGKKSSMTALDAEAAMKLYKCDANIIKDDQDKKSQNIDEQLNNKIDKKNDKLDEPNLDNFGFNLNDIKNKIGNNFDNFGGIFGQNIGIPGISIIPNFPFVIPNNLLPNKNVVTNNNLVPNEKVTTNNNLIPNENIVSNNNLIPNNNLVPDNNLVSNNNFVPNNIISNNNLLPNNNLIPSNNLITNNNLKPNDEKNINDNSNHEENGFSHNLGNQLIFPFMH